MIRTKQELFTNRDGSKSKKYIEIVEVAEDFINEKWFYNVHDYVLNKGEKLVIHRKIQEMSYAQRDAEKEQVLANYEIPGNSESEINKNILPYALLFLTVADPCYGLRADDFELNI